MEIELRKTQFTAMDMVAFLEWYVDLYQSRTKFMLFQIKYPNPKGSDFVKAFLESRGARI